MRIFPWLVLVCFVMVVQLFIFIRNAPEFAIDPGGTPSSLRRRVYELLPRELPPVTAVIPCYNYGNYVLKAVESLQVQRYPKVEILVVNDGSTDEKTLDSLRQLENLEGVRVLHKRNGGLSSARNFGTVHAKSEFVLYLDNDDLVEPLTLELLLLKLLHSGPNVSYTYPAQWFEGDMNLVWIPQEFNFFDLLWSDHPTVCSLVRKSAWAAVGGFDESMRRGMEDWQFWLALARKGHYGARVPIPLFHYLKHGTTMASGTNKIVVPIRRSIIESSRLAGLYTVDSIAAVKKKWRPLISVIIPCYNPNPQWFSDMMESLGNQSMDDFEVIVVDDGSDQRSEVFEMIRNEPRNVVTVVTELIRLSQRLSVSGARNRGALAARGDFILFLDADDLLHLWPWRNSHSLR
jgi:glycosyltransferase involved in cell wall biosynthesis